MRQEEWRYELRALALTCSFLSRDVPLLKAVLAISLERDDGDPKDRPQAWNLQPKRLAKPGTRIQKSVSFEVGFVPKLRIEMSEQPSNDDDEFIVLAHGEGGHLPEWEFKRSARYDFDGIHYLSMSVMRPRYTSASAHVALSAMYSDKRLGIVRRAMQIPRSFRRPHCSNSEIFSRRTWSRRSEMGCIIVVGTIRKILQLDLYSLYQHA